MRNVPIKAAARVRLEIDVTCPDTWGSQCPVEQVHAQARESALRVLHEGRVRQVARVRDDGGQGVLQEGSGDVKRWYVIVGVDAGTYGRWLKVSLHDDESGAVTELTVLSTPRSRNAYRVGRMVRLTVELDP